MAFPYPSSQVKGHFTALYRTQLVGAPTKVIFNAALCKNSAECDCVFRWRIEWQELIEDIS